MSETNEQTSIFDTLRGLVAPSEKKETVKSKTNPKTKTRKKKPEVVVVEELPPKDITTLPRTGKIEYCPKGTRKNRKTGKCEPYEKKKEVPADIPVVEGEKEEPEPEPVIEETSEPEPVVEEKKKRKACPKGMRKNRKTGECEPYEKKKEVPSDIPVVNEEKEEKEDPDVNEASEPEPEPGWKKRRNERFVPKEREKTERQENVNLMRKKRKRWLRKYLKKHRQWIWDCLPLQACCLDRLK